MRGRKPKPEKLKIAAGTSRAGRGPKPPKCAGRVAPPAWLAGEALAEWRRVAPGLVAQGVLTSLDRAAFTVYCSAWASFVAAMATLAKEGATYKSGDLVKKHPAVSLAAEAARLVRLAGERFGLDPFARERLDVEPPVAESAKAKKARQDKARFFPGG